MKAIFSLIPLLGHNHAAALSHSYTITENPYLLSTYFEMQGNDRYIGRVVKETLSIRTVYDLYDPQGNREAQGICHLLSLGTVYPWAKQITVYDAVGKQVGFIEGKLLTTTTARFDFYNDQNRLVGHGYLDRNASAFTIMTESERTIARLKRNFIQDDVDSWKVDQYDDQELDPRILKVFSAFAIDSQEFFKEDR